MKQREFWIRDHGGASFNVEVFYVQVPNSIHVREVSPAYDVAVEGLVEALEKYKTLCIHGQNDYLHPHCKSPGQEALAQFRDATREEKG
jgi:hypothetical protein